MLISYFKQVNFLFYISSLNVYSFCLPNNLTTFLKTFKVMVGNNIINNIDIN